MISYNLFQLEGFLSRPHFQWVDGSVHWLVSLVIEKSTWGQLSDKVWKLFLSTLRLNVKLIIIHHSKVHSIQADMRGNGSCPKADDYLPHEALFNLYEHFAASDIYCMVFYLWVIIVDIQSEVGMRLYNTIDYCMVLYDFILIF